MVAVAILLPLATTIVLETGAAAALGLKRRALTTVAWVNFVTNPPLSLLWMLLAWAGVGFAHTSSDPLLGRVVDLKPTCWGWFALGLFEVLVIVIEWRLFVWVLGRKHASSQKLLVAAVVINTVSAVVGTFALTHTL